MYLNIIVIILGKNIIKLVITQFLELHLLRLNENVFEEMLYPNYLKVFLGLIVG